MSVHITPVKSELSCDGLAESVREAFSQKSPRESLQVMVEVALAGGPGDRASVTASGSGQSTETVAASDDLVIKADRLQWDLGQGPGLDAVRTADVLFAEDLLVDQRWPRWAPLVAGLGFEAVMVVPLFTDSVLGTLHLYSHCSRRYSEDDVAAARTVAAHTSVVLAHARTQQHLWRAIDARNVIGQAQGILMSRYRITADKAFAVLRRHSQASNIRIADIAGTLIATGRLPDVEATGSADHR